MIIVKCPQGFKIRSKEDAELFIKEYVQGDGEVGIKVSDCILYKISRFGTLGTICIFMKTGDIYDIFNPDVRIGYYNPQIPTEADLKKTIDTVYLIRKHINNKWYNSQRR